MHATFTIRQVFAVYYKTFASVYRGTALSVRSGHFAQEPTACVQRLRHCATVQQTNELYVIDLDRASCGAGSICSPSKNTQRSGRYRRHSSAATAESLVCWWRATSQQTVYEASS